MCGNNVYLNPLCCNPERRAEIIQQVFLFSLFDESFYEVLERILQRSPKTEVCNNFISKILFGMLRILSVKSFLNLDLIS